MYELIRSVIQAHTFNDSNALLTKMQRLYVEGTLTEEQYTELRAMLYDAQPTKEYNVESEIDNIWLELRRIANIVDHMPEPTPDPDPDPEIPEWVQPTGAHDAYMMGDKVRYNGDVYESLINGNVWAPDVAPTCWKVVN